jgi:hypothetical protein
VKLPVDKPKDKPRSERKPVALRSIAARTRLRLSSVNDLLVRKIDVVPPLSGVVNMFFEGLAALKDSKVRCKESSSAV